MKVKHFNYTVLFLAMIWIVYNLYQGNLYDNEIEKNGVVTIGKIIKFKGAGKRPYLKYKFYSNGKSYFSDSPRDDKGEKTGEFYKVIFSSKNPKVSRIYLDNRITDKTLILKAGFSEDEIDLIQ